MTNEEFSEKIKALGVIGGRMRSDCGLEISFHFYKDNGLPYPAKGEEAVFTSTEEMDSSEGREVVFKKIHE